MRIWGKIWKDNHMIQDTVYEEYSDDTRTHIIFRGLDEICHRMDLGRPIWLDLNIKEFKQSKKTRFYQDSFVEEIEFDYLEFHIIEE